MFWADEIAQKIKERNLPLEWVDDMKTPSGRVHVGALRGIIVHDLIFRALKDIGVNAKYTYVFEDHDPMDDIPSYLSREEYEKYLGMPLFNIPSPEKGFKNFAEFYALEFQSAFNKIGSFPEILWTSELYKSGKMNDGIKKVLDNSPEVRKIYSELYKKDIPEDWFPFQVYCENCGKVSTTKVYKWDGEFVYYKCPVDATDWTKGCGHEGKTTPFSDENGIKGKMPWKVEWPVKWMAIGVTVEGAGKDHMSSGGSHDLATQICKRVLNYPVPYPLPYEFILVGGKKMSSSKGRGYSAAAMVEILPPELLRFLMVKTRLNLAINFDPEEVETIPKLFDEYQEYAGHFFGDKKDDYARIFELSQIGEIKKPTSLKFSKLVQLVQSPSGKEEIEKENAQEWAEYARIWIEKFAPEKDKFLVQKDLPDVSSLTGEQKNYLGELSGRLSEGLTAEKIQVIVYDLSKEMEIKAIDAFKAIYISLLGNDHGPKASDLIASLDLEFVKKRFSDSSNE